MHIEKPVVTEEQKIKFKKELDSIVKQTPENVQKLWNDNDSILWVLDEPIIASGVHLKFKGREASEFVDLMNKILGRNL